MSEIETNKPLTYLEQLKMEREKQRIIDNEKKKKEEEMQKIIDQEKKRREEELSIKKKRSDCNVIFNILTSNLTILNVKNNVAAAVAKDLGKFCLVKAQYNSNIDYKREYLDKNITFAECFFGIIEGSYYLQYASIVKLLRRVAKLGVKIIGIAKYYTDPEHIVEKDITKEEDRHYRNLKDIEYVYIKLD